MTKECGFVTYNECSGVDCQRGCSSRTPIIQIVDAPATGFLEGWLIALIIVTAVLSGVASHIGMSREASAYQSDRRV